MSNIVKINTPIELTSIMLLNVDSVPYVAYSSLVDKLFDIANDKLTVNTSITIEECNVLLTELKLLNLKIPLSVTMVDTWEEIFARWITNIMSNLIILGLYNYDYRVVDITEYQIMVQLNK